MLESVLHSFHRRNLPTAVPPTDIASRVVVEIEGRRLFININDLKPGDVLLTSTPPGVPDAVHQFIQWSQRLVLPKNLVVFAAWTHAALYIGDGMVWQTNSRKGVAPVTLARFLEAGVHVYCCRLVDATFDADTLAALTNDCAGQAYSLKTTARYYISEILRKYVRDTSGDDPGELVVDTSQDVSGPVICSVFVRRCLFLATYIQEQPQTILPEYKHVLPAHFAASSQFYEIELYWQRADAEAF